MHIKNVPIIPLDSLEEQMGEELYQNYLEALNESEVSLGSNGDTLMTLAQFWKVAEEAMHEYSDPGVSHDQLADWNDRLRAVVHFANEYIADHDLEMNSVFVSVGF